MYIACKEEEFKLFLIRITSAFLIEEQRRTLISTRTIGRNVSRDGSAAEWILSKDARLSDSGTMVSESESKFILITEDMKLACNVSMPLDNGEAFVSLFSAVEKFMPDNAVACLACMSSFIVGAAYEEMIRVCGHIGVPFLYGDYGSCKSLASLCSLSLFGAQKTHTYNNQTTPSYLFHAMKQTTIPIFIDDVDKKSHDLWEELVVDVYNNSPRGTRSYGVEKFRTTPIVSANWQFSNSAGRAFTRCVLIPFSPHTDEPEASQLYSELSQARSKASASVGCMIQIISSFQLPESQRFYHDEVYPGIAAIYKSFHARFKATMTTFMWFFLKVI